MLAVTDDGKGVNSDIDVFKTYVSEKNTESSGLGLFICKNVIESMNGELSYRSADGCTVFEITLLQG